MNAVQVDFAGNCSGIDIQAMTSLLHLGWFFDVVEAGEYGYDSFRCNVFDFVAAGPIDLVFALLRTVGRADAAGCTCFGRVKLSRVLVLRSSLYRFSDLD